MPFFSRRDVDRLFVDLAHLHTHLLELKQQGTTIMATQQELQQAIADLQAKVAEQTAVDQSAIVLIGGLSQQLKDALANAGTDPAAAIQSVRDVIGQMDANDQSLGASVAANTPAAPPAATGAASDPNAPPVTSNP